MRLPLYAPDPGQGVTLLFTAPGSPGHTAVSQGHGRQERRQVWVLKGLADHADFPGLSSMIMARQAVRKGALDQERDGVQYGVSNLTQLSPERALRLLRDSCPLWSEREPLTGRAQRLAARPAAIFSTITGL